MQQGMLLVVFSAVLSITSCFAYGARIDRVQQQQWLSNPISIELAKKCHLEMDNHDIAVLERTLHSLPYPQQEVVRYLLLKSLHSSKAMLSASTERFIEKQRNIPPMYALLIQGQGYELSVPAFDYPQLANQIIKSWRNEQRVAQFHELVEQHQLNLKTWLSGDPHLISLRERLLLRELDQFSADAVAALVHQLTDQRVIVWLPSSSVMVKLAQRSRDPRLYHLLWLMRADFAIEKELQRLSGLRDHFSLQQLELASYNPKLRKAALIALAHVQPMSAHLQTYLLQQLRQENELSYLAQALIAGGYRYWLQHLLETDTTINQKLLSQVLAQ